MAIQGLYNAQQAAQDVITTDWFPAMSKEQPLSFRQRVSDLTHMAMTGVQTGLSPLVFLVKTVGGWILHGSHCIWEPVANGVFPINPVNGKRHFTIPRSTEKFLGDVVFYPSSTAGLFDNRESLPGKTEQIGDVVQRVLNHLKEGNSALLNPEGATPFDYRVRTVTSSQLNAFALPGGGMVVFSQLVKDLEEAVRNQRFKTSKITFADGSTADVDLSNVTLEDALAALMGHEMTHAASRHSFSAIIAQGIQCIVSKIGSFLLIHRMKQNDTAYQEVLKVPAAERTPEQRRLIESKEQGYSKIYAFFSMIGEKISYLFQLLRSRSDEYEADVTGMYFAKQAGYNPKGALLVQELLNQGDQTLRKVFEPLYTHPCGEHRKRALFAALKELDPAALGQVTWNIQKECPYDRSARGSRAVRYAKEASRLTS